MSEGTISVLVVDDSPIDRLLAGRLLQKASIKVEFAEDGGQAMERLKVVAPDLILTDLMMPKVNGLELVEHVRSEYSSIPIVLMTAHGSESTAVQALRRGAASYVPKKALARDLVATVSSVIGLSRKSHRRSQLGACLEQRKSKYQLGNDLAIVAVLIEQLEEELDSIVGFDSATRLQVVIALQEALVNAIYHGNLEVPSELKDGGGNAFEDEAEKRRSLEPLCSRRIGVVAHHERGLASYEVEDEGKGFDFSTLNDPLSGPALERAHGRGLVLIRTFMDHVEHNAKGNRIIMRKGGRGGRQ